MEQYHPDHGTYYYFAESHGKHHIWDGILYSIPIFQYKWDNQGICEARERFAEMKGFEPLRRFRPTAFRVRTLQPLGYISIFLTCPLTGLRLLSASFYLRRRGLLASLCKIDL